MSKWEEAPHSMVRKLDGGLRLTAAFDAMRPKGDTQPPYVANVNGLRLRRRFATLAEAMEGAEKAVAVLCRRALADLEREGP